MSVSSVSTGASPNHAGTSAAAAAQHQHGENDVSFSAASFPVVVLAEIVPVARADVNDDEEQAAADANPAQSCLTVLLYDARIRYLAALAFVIMLLSMDQNLMAPSLTIIAEEFNLTEVERDMYLGGYLSLAYFISGGLASLVCGYLSDKQLAKRRVLLFSSVIFAGELAAVFAVFVTDFTGLLVIRIFAGIAMGGSMPLSYSMMGDIFQDTWRGRVLCCFSTVTGFGVLAGQFVAGLMVPELGWRSPFVAVSIPGLVVTTLFACFAKEPKRAAGERALIGLQQFDYKEKLTLAKLKSKTVLILVFTGLPNSMPWGFLLVYAQDFLMQDCKLSSGDSLTVIIAFSIASGVGTVLSGVVFDLLWRRRMSLAPLFSAVVTAVAVGPMLLIILSSGGTPHLTFGGYVGCALGAGFMVGLSGVSKTAILLNCTLPEARGMVFGLNTVVDDLGKGLASFLIAVMVANMGRLDAFTVATGGWFVVALGFLCTCCTIAADVGRNQAALAAVAAEEHRRQEAEEGRNKDARSAEPEEPEEASPRPPDNEHCDVMTMV